MILNPENEETDGSCSIKQNFPFLLSSSLHFRFIMRVSPFSREFRSLSYMGQSSTRWVIMARLNGFLIDLCLMNYLRDIYIYIYIYIYIWLYRVFTNIQPIFTLSNRSPYTTIYVLSCTTCRRDFQTMHWIRSFCLSCDLFLLFTLLSRTSIGTKSFQRRRIGVFRQKSNFLFLF